MSSWSCRSAALVAACALLSGCFIVMLDHRPRRPRDAEPLVKEVGDGAWLDPRPGPDGELHIWQDVELRFSRAVDELEVAMTGPEGPVEGRLLRVDPVGRWTFEPDELLRTTTAYQLEVAWRTRDSLPQAASWTVTTTDVGDPVDPALIEGRAWLVDFGSARFDEPPGIGYFVWELLFRHNPVVLSSDEVVTGEDGRQRLLGRVFYRTICWPAGIIDQPSALWWDGSRAWLHPKDHPPESPVGGGLVWSGEVEGWFAPDGESIEGLSFAALVDTTPADPMVEGGEPGALCDYASDFVGQELCVPCPDGSSDFCARLRIRDARADPAWGTFDELVDEAAAEAAADPDCPEVFPVECQLPASCESGQAAFLLPLALLLGRRRRVG